MDKKQSYNKALRLRIIELFGTQEEFAKACGISESAISKIIRFVRVPTENQQKTMSAMLKSKRDKLFSPEEARHAKA